MMKYPTYQILVACGLVIAGAATAAADGGAVKANTSGVDLPALPSFDKGSPMYGKQIADYTDLRDSGWKDQYSRFKMTLVGPGGSKTTRDVRLRVREGEEGNKSLLRFTSPAAVKGVAVLIHEHPRSTDEVWLYLPASRRTRRISGANRQASFQGTEFTFEDLSNISADSYKWKFLEEEAQGSQKMLALEARPTYKDSGYSKLIVYINAKLWRAERTVYFDRAGRKLKTLTASDWQHHHGRFWRAQRLQMENHQNLKRTIIEMKADFVNLSLYKKRDQTPRKNLTDAHFTLSALELR